MKSFSTAAKLFVLCQRLRVQESTAILLLTLSVLKVKYISRYKYLGIVLDIELSDDKDIQRQMRYQYEAVNKRRVSFSRCSNPVKKFFSSLKKFLRRSCTDYKRFETTRYHCFRGGNACSEVTHMWISWPRFTNFRTSFTKSNCVDSVLNAMLWRFTKSQYVYYEPSAGVIWQIELHKLVIAHPHNAPNCKTWSFWCF